MTVTLSHGDRSQAVALLQKKLNASGAKLRVDGDYGDETEKAVRVYQRKVGLVDDGIAGSKTQDALAGKSCANLLGHADLSAAAKRLGVDIAIVLAVNQVESLGNGFASNGKPTLLFERHIMYRQLCSPQHPDDDAKQLKQHADELARLYPNLINSAPGGYAGGTAEHQRLARARMIDDSSALASASWGAFQIMGYHWQLLGYSSVQEFAERMAKSEAEQFEAFVRFIEADPALHKALKNKKWAEFAKRYNGPSYARNLYDTKLERAYLQHAQCQPEALAA
ncbi:N-acetylmuramidase domain-containing protein [Pseudomonas marincola]|uniref:N-acetylmuramidase domain-containing protein n=1 Tax=Pseudomonas marincola TaxID=437900 RepID=UPI0008ECB84F|nr:N-acetylmuramidase family protein [Pseudomonas marincola]SFT48882.1 Peptidoglycan-binding (PGRP) domain of peptidoglycan hydrolases-containing protein [Pseudomonas marincola]